MRVILLALLVLVGACANRNADADIVAAYKARLAALTEAVEQGKITPAEANARALEYERDAETQAEMRRTMRVQQRAIWWQN